MSNSTKWNVITIVFLITCPLDYPKGQTVSIPWDTYHSASIENIFYYQPPSIVIQSIGIYDHIRDSPTSQSILLILAQTQYTFKVKSLCNRVA